MTRLIDTSIVVTFHSEGLIAHNSLLSLSRCRAAAEDAGVAVELIAILDRADQETERVVRSYDAAGKPDAILSLDVGDLGLARNRAIEAATGRWVLVCDGDDYLSGDFIVRCVQASTEFGVKTILHPELVLMFGAWQAISWQVGDDDHSFDPACMLVCNPWNSCCFAERSVFIQTPYQPTRSADTGFGFEDWHWNCETLAAGFRHRIAKATTHYVRKKARASLNEEHSRHHALIPRTQLFDVSR